ncbi:DUF262 domain-containing protein [soil metagenome]
MPTLSLQPTARSIGEVLTGPAYYRIPRFQRPYSWEIEHIDDFWLDAVQNRDSGYFIGPMVVYKENAQEWGIVDGQQRLTTITLLLASIRDELEAIGEQKLANALHRYIERPDVDDKSRFVLQSDVDETKWIKAVQLRKSQAKQLKSHDLDAPSWSALQLLRRRIQGELADARATAKTVQTQKEAMVRRLRDMRDQVLSLTVIWVPLDTEDDAYEIFETLNSRGKDLELSDRLKNFYLGHLRALNANVDDYRDRWNLLRERFAGEPLSRDINRFILHWWLSRAPYVAERRVFKEIKKTVLRPKVARTFEQFEEDVDRYRIIVDPGSVTWTIEKLPVLETLRAFQTMRLAQPMPFVLSVLRAYDSKHLTLKAVIRVLSLIENYHFQVTAIATRSSSGGVSEMYASHARQLTDASSQKERQEQLRDLLVKLRSRIPNREEFVEAFIGRFAFSEDYPRDRRLLQYTLGKLHAAVRPNPPVDFSKFTLEHLIPQNEIESSDDLALVGSIGNLIYVHEDLNTKLGGKTFSSKRVILKRHSASYELDDVVAAKDWGEDQILARASRLGGLAYNAVWKV